MSNNRRHMRHIRTSMMQYVQTTTSEIPSGSVIASVNQVPTPAELENIANPSEFILCGGVYYRLTGKQPSTNESLNYGEIAVAYRDGHERLFIKNSDNEIVEFIPWKYSDMPTRLSTLTDVSIDNATLASGQVLSYDGNSWTNSDVDISIAENITYASLYSKLNMDQLEPNKLYRITDYVTITKNDASAASDITYKSAQHAFDLVVRAASENSLDCMALAVQHSGDSYFNNSLMRKWEVWYDIENDTALYDWADENNGKGVIYRMIDEYGNDCPYDFKNFQFKRKLDSNGELDKNGTQYWVYTFSLYSSSAITDSTLGQANLVHDNTMKPKRGDYLIPNDNVFIGQYIRHNTMSYSCSSNTMHGICQDNELGMHCSNIVLYDSCAYNIFGQHSERIELLSNGICNTFGEYCTNIYLGPTSQGNTFGKNVTFVQSDDAYPVQSNTIGDNSNGIVFLYGGSGNMVGDSTSNVEFGNQARENKIGGNCSEITIGDYCENNTIGDNCLEVMVGDRAAMNNIHDNCSYIRFKNSDGTANTTYTRFIEVEGGNQLINLYAANGSASSYLQNIYIAQGVNNSNNWLTIDSIARNLPYRTTVGRTTPDTGMSIGTLRIYNEDDEMSASAQVGTVVTNLSTAQAVSGGESLSGTINLHKVAKTGTYNDIIGTPTLSAVATSGSYSDLSGTPTLATVATTGDYNDLIGTPTIPADEKVKVGTLSEYNTSRQVVTHSGHGTTGEGYGTDNFVFRISSETTTSGVLTVNTVKNDLRIGHFTTTSPTGNNTNVGRITLSCGKPGSTMGGTEGFGALEAPSSTMQTVNTLPVKNGELLSSGGLASSSTSSVVNGVVSNTTYYQCLYRGGNVYAPAMGSGGGGGGTSNDYPEAASWNNGTTNGPTLKLSSVNTNFPSLTSSDPIPSASTSYSGVVTTGTQTFGGQKVFNNGIETKGLKLTGSDNHIQYQASSSSTLYTYEVPRDNGLIPIIPNHVIVGNGLAAIDSSNGTIAIGPQFVLGTATGRFLADDGTWRFPSGGGGGGDNYYPESASWNNGTDSGPSLTLSASTNNFPTLNVGSIPSAGASQSGVVTTTSQTFAGTKVFNNRCSMSGGIILPQSAAISCRISGGSRVEIDIPSSSGTMGVIGSGTATHLAAYDNTNGIIVTGAAIGSDTTKFLRNDGTWAVPAGGGGGGGSTVTFTEGPGYGRSIGLNLGELSIDGVGYTINIRPARVDIDNGTSINTRQGVMKPLFESFNSVMDLHSTNFRNTLQIDSSCIACTNFVIENNTSVSDFVAVPVIVDYYINEYTGALESIPYILLPKETFGDLDLTKRFVIGTINPIEDQVDPDRRS